MRLNDQTREFSLGPRANMHELADIYLYCFTMELNRVSHVGQNQLASIITRFQHLVGRRKPYLMFAPTQLVDMGNLVFGELSDEIFTDFILGMTVSLQANLIRAGQDLNDLFRDLTASLVILEEGTASNANVTSTVYADRFSTSDTVLRTLKGNRWLLTILLGSLFLPEVINVAQEAINPTDKKRRVTPTTNNTNMT